MCQQRTLLRRGGDKCWAQVTLARGPVVQSRCVAEVWGFAGCGMEWNGRVLAGCFQAAVGEAAMTTLPWQRSAGKIGAFQLREENNNAEVPPTLGHFL